MATTYRTQPRPAPVWWITQGLAGGILAGIVFALFETLASVALRGGGAALLPLRLVGALVLGRPALDSSDRVLAGAFTGLVVHFVLAGAFGVVLALLTWAVPALTRSTGVLVAAASAYGLLLWLVNFYVVAPAAGWAWFPEESNPVVQLLAHTFCFGAMLGLYLDRVRLRRPGSGDVGRDELARV